MRQFRTLNKWYAYLMGYFWIPCPMCGRMFGGHECSESSIDNKILCWRCPAGVRFAIDGNKIVVLGISNDGAIWILDD